MQGEINIETAAIPSSTCESSVFSGPMTSLLMPLFCSKTKQNKTREKTNQPINLSLTDQ